MPHRPYWYRTLGSALHWAEAISDPVLDRRAVEMMLQVRQTEAQRIIKMIGGFRLAGALVVSRIQFIEWIRRVQRSDKALEEEGRIDRLDKHLADTKKLLAARRVTIKHDPAVQEVENMPKGIHLRPGELRIEFYGTEDLLRHLMELAQVITHDYVRFQSLIEE